MNSGLTQISDSLRQTRKTLEIHHGFMADDEITGPPPLDDARRRRWAALVPERFETATLDDLDAKIAGPITNWVADPAHRNLILLGGGLGVGKTHAALAAARARMIDHSDSVKFAPTVELLDSLRPGTTDPDAYDDAIGCDLLVLDDVGTEKPSEWTGERLYAIVNRRWLECRPIIATSNLTTREQLETALGPRVMSRLAHDAVVIGVGGRDRRQ